MLLFFLLMSPIRFQNTFGMNKSVPYIRSNPGDGHVPLWCNSDKNCPVSSRCYIPKNKPGKIGVCVVSFDEKLLKSKNPTIWL